MPAVFFVLLATAIFPRVTLGTHFFGCELIADVYASASCEVIRASWRLIWNPSTPSGATRSLYLNTCSTGSPCPGGTNPIDMGSTTCLQPVATQQGMAIPEL